MSEPLESELVGVTLESDALSQENSGFSVVPKDSGRVAVADVLRRRAKLLRQLVVKRTPN
jgi:hypothetical protein